MKFKLVDLTGGQPRLDKRVNEARLAFYVAVRSCADNDWTVDVRHGGGGAYNPYSSSAVQTECALAVSNPSGLVVVWLARVDANGTTERGAAEACLLGAGDLWDGRVKRQARKDAAWELLKAAWNEHVSAIDQLGALSGEAM